MIQKTAHQWHVKSLPSPVKIEEICKAINVNNTLGTMLLQRDIDTFDKAKAFFRPQLSDLHDPFLMKDMDKAVARLQKAMATQEKILIFGDYDVDGTTAVSVFYGFLKYHYAHLGYYIPDRYKEGYGVSYLGIDFAQENGYTLMITLDCGIKSLAHVAYAKSKGIDFIICDHHRPGEVLPDAVAVLDQKRIDCAYPYKELSGCGVGFKFLQAYCIAENIPQDRLMSYLDLLAISIAADIVPITGENRVMTYYGLKVINDNPRPGIKALIDIAGLKNTIEIGNVVFGFAPRINAAGRLAHASAAVALMLADTDDAAMALAHSINEHNTDRKELDADITAEALRMIQENDFLRNGKGTVIYKDDWHKGVVGIVASRCIEHFYKPTIVLTKSGDFATGSARSVRGFDVYEAIAACDELLEQYGGHMYAAGMSLKLENVDAFCQKFNQIVTESIREDQLYPVIEADVAITLDQINAKFYALIKQLAPFGPGNMQPIFITTALIAEPSSVKILKDEHLKMTVRHQGANEKFDAIAFRMAHYYDVVTDGKAFNLCYTIDENTFRDRTTLQLMVKDIQAV
jgi:single-stranded-DNA-specific exonuclease